MPETDSQPPSTAFLRLVQLSTSVSFGAMTAALYSIKEVNPSVQFEVSVAALVWFVVAGVVTWFFWQPLIRSNPRGERKQQRRALIGMIVVLGLGLVLATLRALRNHDQLSEVFEGALMAGGVLAFVGFLVRQAGRLLEDEPPPPDRE